jgi:phosphosulfolactate phosphohydrolase-like enzyme
VLVCAGTREIIATEDVLAAGALGELLSDHFGIIDAPLAPSLSPFERGEGVRPNDSVKTALNAWRKAKSNLFAAVSDAENARRLLAIPELCDDVAFCLRQDVYNLIAALGRDGTIRILI